ncbi:MAG TPA: hypothetical protein VHR41_14640 [Gemmatimonadales bacterium]|nr:hypothetical protein [Gemmatimonadales bacterium]
MAEAVAPPSPDVAFYMFGAQRVLQGSRLYRDLIDLNPPLIFWLNIPPALMAGALHLSPLAVYRFSVTLVLISVLAVSQDSLRRICQDSGELSRASINAMLVFALLALPGEAFGQREHLMFALALPYILCVVAQASSPEPVRSGWLIGLLAGIGFSLKPYFLILWVVLEVWLRRKAPATRLARSELLATALVVLAYGLAVCFLTPEYFTVVRVLGEAYRKYMSLPVVSTLVVGEGSTIPLLTLLVYATVSRRAANPVLVQALALALASLLLAAALQQKGWWYHFYPSSAVSVVLLGIMVIRARAARARFASGVYGLTAAAALAFLCITTVVRSVSVALHPFAEDVTRYPGFHELLALVRQRAPGGTLMIWSFNIRSAFPLVTLSGARWGSRFPSMWLVPASYWDAMPKPGPARFRPLSERSAAERLLDSAMVTDMRSHPPEMLLILSPSRDSGANGFERLDLRSYFAMDPEIAQMLTCYRYVELIGVHEVYQRSDAGACRQ